MLLFLNGNARKQRSMFSQYQKKEEKLATKERLATMASGSQKRRLSDTARSALNRYLRLTPASLVEPQLSGGFLIPQAKRNSNSNSDILARRPESSDSQARRVTCHVSSASPVSRPTRAHDRNWEELPILITLAKPFKEDAGPTEDIAGQEQTEGRGSVRPDVLHQDPMR
ncbi:hypothetical protein NDU88_008731 [Pleurodeles waltl]|uniref:Uncharacterized protein n=1 Tax=Pleurodeles waltl TaxID=8319 RepID=A0AAV7QSN7_PLEWA|nr:hypothetical protein NDU88_008731 [Pleurodeles waltl]